MHRNLLVSISLVTLVFVSACSKSSAPDPAAQAGAAATKAVAPKPPCSFAPDTKPEQIVAAFYDAMKSGNEQSIGALLSDAAWKATQESDYEIQSPGLPTAQYRIAPAEFFASQPGGAAEFARVASVLSSTDETGTHEQEIFWLLRLQADGWRVRGLAAATAPGTTPAEFNFEDPVQISQALGQTQPVVAETPAANPASVQQAQNPPDAPATIQR